MSLIILIRDTVFSLLLRSCVLSNFFSNKEWVWYEYSCAGAIHKWKHVDIQICLIFSTETGIFSIYKLFWLVTLVRIYSSLGSASGFAGCRACGLRFLYYRGEASVRVGLKAEEMLSSSGPCGMSTTREQQISSLRCLWLPLPRPWDSAGHEILGGSPRNY